MRYGTSESRAAADIARADSHQSPSTLRFLFFLVDIGQKLSDNQEKSFENVVRCGKKRSRAEEVGKGVGEPEMGGRG